jgi:hypothetical protein
MIFHVKIWFKKQKGIQASVLLIALAVTTLIGMGLASYLMLVSSQHRLVAQSQAWNTALTVAEAGIEEGMAQINAGFGTNYAPSTQTNWGGPTAGVYGPRISSLTNGSYGVVIIQGSPAPTLIATGYTVVPFVGQQIKRVVQVQTRTSFAFAGAIGALQDVTMNGNFIMVDSYDSADTNHSDANGNYYAPTRKAGGDVSSTGGFLNVGNANIYGHVRTAPFGSASTGPNGRVGDLPANWNGSGIESGWYLNDYNANFPDVPPPYSSGFSVLPNGSGTNTYVLGTGDYYVNGDFSIANKETLYISGNATLYVTGNFTMSGQNGSFISIAPGATLKLYVGTETGPSVSSTFMNVNNTGNAYNFQYYGLPSNTSATWSGNSSYIGTVYAPEAVFTLNGGGNGNPSDYQGACVVNSVVMNGHFNFHYDENLSRSGPISGFTISSWREL